MDYIITIIAATSGFFVGFGCVFLINQIWDVLKQKKQNYYLTNNRLANQLKINQERADFYVELQKRKLKLEENLQKKTKQITEKSIMIDKQETVNQNLGLKLSKIKQNYELEVNNLTKERDQIINKLEEISGLSKEEAKKQLFVNLEKSQNQKLNKMIKDKLNDAESKLHSSINNLLATAIERYSSKYVTEKTNSKIELKSEELKGKIIGKEGRNIKSFEEESGTDIIIENDSQVIKVSSFNPVRRAIAVEALHKLIQDGRIQPQRIRDTLEMERKNIDLIISQAGKDVVNDLKIFDFPSELIYHVGLLKYRTSYGQSVLEHSIEVAKLAGAMAKELKLDDELAIRGGLLHDIGKSKDYEIGLSHVELGVQIAKKHQENDIIINIIESHHDDVPKNNIYSILVSAADTLSAARPGARDKMQEDYIRRMETIERICSNFPGVKNSYAIKLGRTIRVIVDSSKVDDLGTETIASEITQKLKNELRIPGDVLVEVIREFRINKKI